MASDDLDPCPAGCGRSHDSFATVMCSRCWRRVPKPLQRAVYAAWRGRQAFPGDRGKVAAHEAAKAAAIRSVTTP